MSARLMREGLAHTRPGMKDNDFFLAIDATGGWPPGYQFVGFEHTDERAAGFSNDHRNTGWWTTLYSADDYYLWKLSPEAIARFAEGVRRQLVIPAVNLQRLSVDGWRNGSLPLAGTKWRSE